MLVERYKLALNKECGTTNGATYIFTAQLFSSVRIYLPHAYPLQVLAGCAAILLDIVSNGKVSFRRCL